MPTILYIILITVTQSTLWNQGIGNHYIWKGGIGIEDKEIIDEWKTSIQDGHSITGGKAFYKAILFTTKDALDRFFKTHDVKGAILIDVKNGIQNTIKQKTIYKTVNKETQEIDCYEVLIE